MATIPTDDLIPQSSTQFSGSSQPRISLIARDWSTIRRALLELIRVRFPNEWKDFSASGVGMSILEVVAYSHAQIGYYVDSHANECFITTARTLGGMRRRTAALNYRMRLATSAGVSLTAFIYPTIAAKVRIDEGTVFEAKNKTKWTISNTVLIPENTPIYPDIAGISSNLILASEGQIKQQTYQSDGAEWQKFILPESNVVESSISVAVDGEDWYQTDSLVFSEGYGFAVDGMTSDGTADQDYLLTNLWPRSDNFYVSVGSDPSTAIEWEQVDDFSGSSATDTHYTLDIDPVSGEATVTFGDGTNGAIPTNNEKIVFTYNVVGPQKRYQLVIEPDGLVSVRFGDGDGAVIPELNSTIVVDYRVGSGLLGNISIGDIDATITGYNATTGAAVSVRLQNTEPSAGAEAAETVDHAREYAPKVASSTGRASTANDYDGLINTFVHPDYGKAAFGKAALHSEFPESNQVDLALWSRDSDGRVIPSPETFRDVMKVYIESRADICHYIVHEGGEVVYIDLDARIAINSTLDVPGILEQITDAVTKYFTSSKILPGQDVYVSQIIAVIQAIAGVSYVIIDSIALSKRNNSLYAIGDGVKGRFHTATFGGYDADAGYPIIAGTFSMENGDQSITDDLSGNLVGDVDAAGVNEVVYDDVEQTEDISNTGTLKRFYTPYHLFKKYVVPDTQITYASGKVGDAGGLLGYIEIDNTTFSSYGFNLVVTDGVQYAYAKSTNQFAGDVSAAGGVSSGTGGVVRFWFTFTGAITGSQVVAYCLYETVANSKILDDSLAAPVRESTAILRMGDHVAVDDGLGNLDGDIYADTRDEANSIVYEDEEVENEDVSEWTISTTSYRGRLKDVPLHGIVYGNSVYGSYNGLSPLIRPGSVIFSDGASEVTDEDNGDGTGTFVGDNVDTSKLNVIYYEDCVVENKQLAPQGETAYTDVLFPKNVLIPDYINVNYADYYFRLRTQVFNGVFETLIFEDIDGDGQFETVTVNGTPGSVATYLAAHSINYAQGLFGATFNFTTTSNLNFSYIVRGGTFDLNLSAAFATPASLTVSYRKATGGTFDVTFANADASQPLYETWNQALGGNFDLTFADTPALNSLVTIDYRYLSVLELEDQFVLSVPNATTETLSGQLENYPVKKGSFVLKCTVDTPAAIEIRDDGRGNLVSNYLVSTGRNYIDYVTGVYTLDFIQPLLNGSDVTVDYDSYSEPEDVIPILKNQIADIANINLTQIDPRDF